MNIRRSLIFAGIGWAAGLLIALLMAFLVMPAFIGGERTFDPASDWIILAMGLLITSPGALIGGLLGGNLTREGGSSTQRLMAAIVGLILAVPISCIALWYLGW